MISFLNYVINITPDIFSFSLSLKQNIEIGNYTIKLKLRDSVIQTLFTQYELNIVVISFN